MSRRAARNAPSANHPGRQAHNWSIYDAGDRMLQRYRGRFRGVLFDLGCGKRTYERFIGPLCERYLGVDWSQSLHGVAADVLADLNQPLPFASGCADTVISFSVMEHLRRPREFLAEAARLLRPGGSIVLQVPFMWWVHEAPVDYFRFTRFGLSTLFEDAGFVGIEIAATTGFWTMWLVKLNYQLARLVRGPRVVRWLSRACLVPIFWFNQQIARWLDRVWPNGEAETAGYFVVAHKSCP